MDILIRFSLLLLHIIGLIIHPIHVLQGLFKKGKVPSIKNDVLKIPATDLADRIRNRKLKSEDVVKAYIERIQLINPILNAVIEDRFEDAIQDAKRADQICATMNPLDIIKKYPILGVPFTVKESCSVKGLSHVIANIDRKDLKATKDGVVVEKLRAAGGIPLLVSANPEYCLSWECNSIVSGRTLNPYNTSRTSGGSSGGEAALNGAGASPFGIGSDLAGSIRMPALYTGIFGHKPTGTLLDSTGHYPMCTDEKFPKFLQLGPMTRFAKDLPLLLEIMAGENAYKLNFDKPINTKDIKIYYLEDAGPTLVISGVSPDIKLSILKAVEFFKQNGLFTQKAKLSNMQDTLEYGLANFFSLTETPDLLAHPDNPKQRDNVTIEILKSILGLSKYSFAALYFIMLQETNGFMSKGKVEKLVAESNVLREKIINMLGTDGVLFYPTYIKPALRHNTSFTNLGGVMYPMICNYFGLPATHVPMGMDRDGLPIGFQVIAAPFQDKLCLTIACELENAFGGWVPPS